jgi:IS30 family transposase
MARPSRLTAELRERIELELGEGVPVTVTARRVGVGPRTLHRWLKEGRVQRHEQPDPLSVHDATPSRTTDLDERRQSRPCQRSAGLRRLLVPIEGMRLPRSRSEEG